MMSVKVLVCFGLGVVFGEAARRTVRAGRAHTAMNSTALVSDYMSTEVSGTWTSNGTGEQRCPDDKGTFRLDGNRVIFRSNETGITVATIDNPDTVRMEYPDGTVGTVD